MSARKKRPRDRTMLHLVRRYLLFSNTTARQRFASFQAAHLTLIQSRVGPET
jgi:hypothetical protein